MFCIWEREWESEHRVRRLESKIYTCKLYCIWFFFLLEYKVGGGRAAAKSSRNAAFQSSNCAFQTFQSPRRPRQPNCPKSIQICQWTVCDSRAASSCSPTYAARSETPKGDGELLQLPLNRSCHQNMRKISKIPGSLLNAEFCVEPQPIWISIK